MSPRSIGLDDELSAYVAAHSTPPDAVRRQHAALTATTSPPMPAPVR